MTMVRVAERILFPQIWQEKLYGLFNCIPDCVAFPRGKECSMRLRNIKCFEYQLRNTLQRNSKVDTVRYSWSHLRSIVGQSTMPTDFE